MCFPPKFQRVQLHGVLFFAATGLLLCKSTSMGLILRECEGTMCALPSSLGTLVHLGHPPRPEGGSLFLLATVEVGTVLK